MPARVNGIGTTYLGKTNVERFPGVCNSCRRQVNLENYETRLWFTVLFVPLIPLQKKQVLNYCPACTKHYAPSATEWTRVQDQAIGEATAKLAAAPHSAEASLNLFGTLIGFRRNDQAAALAKAMLTEFPTDPDVHLCVADWHDTAGRKAESHALFQRALQLAPDNLGAKRAVALCHLENNDPARAAQLLAASPPLNATAAPGVYFLLAKAYQTVNQHPEALAVFRQVKAAAPSSVRDPAFRKAVKVSEAATGAIESLLPFIAWYRRPWAIWGGIAVAILTTVVGINAYIANHRTVFVVNGFAAPVQVQLDGGETITVPPQKFMEISLPEGTHHAAVSCNNRPLGEDEFAISAGFFARFFSHPEFVLNAGRGAVIVDQEVTYRVNPNPNDRGKVEFFLGKPFVTIPGVDYRFQEFPREIELRNGAPTNKRRVDFLHFPPLQSILTAAETGSTEDLLTAVEAHLQVTPSDRDLLTMYTSIGGAKKQSARCKEFLAKGIDRRPVEIEWHRMVQTLARFDGTERQLFEQYQKWLAKDPDNSALLYLTGRLERRPAEAQQYYDRAITADKTNPYPWRAKAWHQELSGDFAGALRSSEQACQLAPDQADLQEQRTYLKLALRDLDGAESDLRSAIGKEPLDFESVAQLLVVLTVKGQPAQAQACLEEHVQALKDKQVAPTTGIRLRVLLDYLQSEFDRMTADTASMEPAAATPFLFQADFERGKLQDAADRLKSGEAIQEGYVDLCLAIAWRGQKNLVKADEWQKSAVAHLQAGDQDDQAVAKLLADPKHVTFEQARDVQSDTQNKAIVLTALAQQASPADRKPIAELADKLNYRRQFPYHFLKRTLATVKEGGEK